MEEVSTVFHSSAYHYRRKPVLVISLALLMICTPLFLRLLRELVQVEQPLGKTIFGLICTTILGLFAFIGVCLLRFYLVDRSLPLVINREGVRYGDRFFPWQDIGGLQRQPGASPVQLLLRRRGRIAPDCRLMTNDGLSAAESDALMVKLQAEVSPLYQHLSFA